MNINITSIRIVKNADSFRIAMRTDENIPQYKNYETFFVISEKEYHFLARECMLGLATVYPYFDDGTASIKFYPQGLSVMYYDRRPMEYFYLPMNELVKHIDQLMMMSEGSSIELNSIIEDWKEKYGPKIRLNVEQDVLEKLKKDEELTNASGYLFDRLKKVASNNSDGDLVEVYVSFDPFSRNDSQFSSYSFAVSNGKNVIINGGYIPHKNKNGEYEYSIHT